MEQSRATYLLHIVASSDVYYDVFCIHELSRNIERIGERDEDGFVWRVHKNEN